MKKIIDIILVLLFVLFAVVQWNDPDSLLWIVMYLLVAVVILSSLMGRYQQWPTWIFLGVLIISIATYIPAMTDWLQDGMPSITNSMKAESPYIELVREFFGLFISALAVAGYAWWHKKAGV